MGIRHFERNHQRRQRDSEDHQIESFQPVDDLWEDSQQPMNLSQKTMDHQFYPVNFNPQTESEQVQYSHIFTMMLVACYQLLSFLGLQKTYWCLVGNGWERGNGIIINSYCGSFPHSLLSTRKKNLDPH